MQQQQDIYPGLIEIFSLDRNEDVAPLVQAVGDAEGGQPLHAAGQRQPDGTFEADSVNARVDETLRRLMETAKELMKEEKGKAILRN